MKIRTTVFGTCAILSVSMMHAHEGAPAQLPDLAVNSTVLAVDLAQIINVGCGDAFGCSDRGAAVTEQEQTLVNWLFPSPNSSNFR